MSIGRKDTNTHVKWLNGKFHRVCYDSILIRKESSDTLCYELRFQPKYGKKKSGQSPSLKIEKADSDLRKADSDLRLEFQEEWRCSGTKSKKYRFRRLTLKLLSGPVSAEMLSVHWNCDHPNSEPYEPHWHFAVGREGFYLKYLHIPLNSSWGIDEPNSLSEYHDWLSGFFQFAVTELPRSLEKKRTA